MQTLSGKTLEAIAIERLKEFEPEALRMHPDGYYVAYSGGKDSDVVLDLVRCSGVKYDAHHNLTTCDPPEVVLHAREQKDVTVHRPPLTMWQLIRKKKTFPLRCRRWCCWELKEGGGSGRLVVTGIRWQESHRRADRKMVESCYRDKTKRYLNIIIDWSTSDVWRYIRANGIQYCPLYDEGFTRLGCVLCPMQKQAETERDKERFPRIARAWERAIKDIWEPKDGTFPTPESLWQWWLNREAPVPLNDADMPLFFRD